MNSRLRIVFMGTPEFATESLKRLVEKGYDIVGVVTAPDRPAGRGQKIRYSSVKEYALSKNLKILQPENLKDSVFIEELRGLKADIQLVVAFRMLPEIVWNMPQKGTLNLHASLLPQYRGAAPINWAIMNGDEKTGVTTFFIEKEIDTGNIIYQESIAISPTDSAGDLHDKLMLIGSKLICKTIDAIENNKAPTIPQQNDSISYAPKIFKADCKIDWHQSAKKIHNKIRGLSPYPTAWSVVNEEKNQSLKLYKSSIENINHNLKFGTVITSNNSELKVAVKDGFILLHEVQLSGKKKMKTHDFLRGFTFPENTILN